MKTKGLAIAWRGLLPLGGALLASSALFLGAARAGEALEVEKKVLPPAGAPGPLEVEIRATARAGPIEGFVLSVTFDPRELAVRGFLPAGEWLSSNPPDFVHASGTPAAPGPAGAAGLTVVLDTEPGGPPKAIPPAAGGALQQVAALTVDLLAQPPPGSALGLGLKLVDGAALSSGGLRLVNSLVIGGKDYFAGSSEQPLSVSSVGVSLLRLRGDGNGDGARDISDAVFILAFLFLGGPQPPCPQLADANGDGTVDISDAVFLLGFLFLGGPEPDPAEGCL